MNAARQALLQAMRATSCPRCGTPMQPEAARLSHGQQARPDATVPGGRPSPAGLLPLPADVLKY